MCKHSTKTIDKLAERQRGMDARGNDPMATQRESSWATDLVKAPPVQVLGDTLDYLAALPDTMTKPNGKGGVESVKIKGMSVLKGGLAQLRPNNATAPTGPEFAEFFSDKSKSEFKWVVDNVGEVLEARQPKLHAKARDNSFFKDRGRSPPPRERRNSINNRHAGITTGADRTPDTVDAYAAPVFHAKGQFRLELDSQTVKEFQKSGAPYVAGASGTMQYIALSMEDTSPVDKAKPDERAKRERVLAMLSAQHVAQGHHSMAECLVAVKPYGYFKDIPDPLTDYDGAMKALDERLKDLGFGDSQPLSRDNKNQNKSKEQIQYEDRFSFVRTLHGRYKDQLSPGGAKVIKASMDKARDNGDRAFYDQALASLARAERDIQAEAALITAKARGNNHVLRPEELVARMGAAPKVKKNQSVEYKAVKDALASYEQSLKELAGRKLDHDQAELAFEELRAALATAEKAATAYKAKHENAGGKQDRVGVMDDLLKKLHAEKTLMFKTEEKFDQHGIAALTIEQAIEYERFGVDITKQAAPQHLGEERITGKTVLGSGGINTVMLVDYAADATHPAGQFAFKPEPEAVLTHAAALDDRGIDQNKPKFGKRNIATRKMADAAGLGDLIPKAVFTTVDGRLGLLMDQAGGESPAKRVKAVIPDPASRDDLKHALAAKDADEPGWEKKIPAKDGRGMRYGYDKATDTFTIEELRASSFRLKPSSDNAREVAAVQEQLIDLQWVDALCGQTDRHAENYLVDTSSGRPVVVGIDNDFSFGTKQVDPRSKESSFPGLPPLVDEKTFLKMKAMNWATINQSLADELDQAELAAAKQRFDLIQTELDQLKQNGMVIKDWTVKINNKTVTEHLSAPGSFTDYYKRDVEYQDYLG